MQSAALNRFTEKSAKIVSMIFIPPNVVLWSMVFMGYLREAERDRFIYSSVTAFLFGFVLPIVFFLVLMKQKKISDIHARIKEERTTPYLFGIALLIVGLILLLNEGVNHDTAALWISYLACNIVIIVVNKFWKISAHATGVGVMLGAFTAISPTYTLPLLIAVLLVAWSRIYLKCHTFAQVTAGSILGAAVAFINIKFF